ncbi:MAG: hypothetical protein ACXWMV_08380 [Syntrophales bacterium]
MKRREAPEKNDPQNESDLFEQRCRRRLREILGANASGIDAILRLRRQVLTLRSRVHELEVQLASLEHCYRNSLLTRYRETYVETSWRDLRREDEGDD